MSRYFDTWKSLPGYEYCRTSGESNDGRWKSQQRKRSRSRKRNALKSDVGNNTYHSTDGKLETKVGDMGERAECYESSYDCKFFQIPGRNGRYGIYK